MRIALDVGSFGLDTRWIRTRDPRGRVVLRFLWRLVRPAPEPFDLVISRSVDQAFADFAREMAA
jgi:hypothetical protein